MLDKKLEMKSSFGEIKVIDIKMKEETSKYEKSWRKITVEGNKRVKATFIWKKIKLINDTWRIEKTRIIYIYINMKIQCSYCCEVASVVSDSVWPHMVACQAFHPWDSPGKNTGVGCHFLLQCMKVRSESEVAQSCLTLSDPMNCSPGSSIHRIFAGKSTGVGCQGLLCDSPIDVGNLILCCW